MDNLVSKLPSCAHGSKVPLWRSNSAAIQVGSLAGKTEVVDALDRCNIGPPRSGRECSESLVRMETHTLRLDNSCKLRWGEAHGTVAKALFGNLWHRVVHNSIGPLCEDEGKTVASAISKEP